MFKLENSVVENKFISYAVCLCAYMLTCGRRREEHIHSNPPAPPQNNYLLVLLQMTLNAFYQYLR